jgi:hypothetical protein
MTKFLAPRAHPTIRKFLLALALNDHNPPEREPRRGRRRSFGRSDRRVIGSVGDRIGGRSGGSCRIEEAIKAIRNRIIVGDREALAGLKKLLKRSGI